MLVFLIVVLIWASYSVLVCGNVSVQILVLLTMISGLLFVCDNVLLRSVIVIRFLNGVAVFWASMRPA